MIPLCPLVAANTCPHHRSLHQLKHHPPIASFPFPGFGAPRPLDWLVEPVSADPVLPVPVVTPSPMRGWSSVLLAVCKDGRETVLVSCQSSSDGERQVYILKYESVDIVAYPARSANMPRTPTQTAETHNLQPKRIRRKLEIPHAPPCIHQQPTLDPPFARRRRVRSRPPAVGDGNLFPDAYGAVV